MNFGVDIPTQWFRLAEIFQTLVKSLFNSQFPQYLDFVPFIKGCDEECFIGEKFLIAKLESLQMCGIPCVGKLHDDKLISIARDNVDRVSNLSYSDLRNLFGENAYTFEKFTYYGPVQNNRYSFEHLQALVVEWINDQIFPVILEANRKRVLDAIPTPPKYRCAEVLTNSYVLEDESAVRQGTAFHLTGVGLITCAHAVTSNVQIFSPINHLKKYRTEIVAKNDTIDLVILKAPDLPIAQGIIRGSADKLKQMDHVAVVGFPNYQIGDTGILSPGLVIGFRMRSGIRRILVNAPIIAGNSGGPVINSVGEVIGVAVTGSDKMENATMTEDHGIVPIDALSYLHPDDGEKR